METRKIAVARSLHATLAALIAPMNRRPVRRQDDVSGWDEMQGYPPNVYGDDTVGVSWSDLGRGANLMFNPVAQYHAVRDYMRGPQGQQRQQLPGPPQLPPGAAQAYQRGPAKLLAYMGLGSLSWASTDTATEKLLSAEPQAAFRGRRLVMAQAKSSGAGGILVTVSQPLTVSGMPQTPAPQQVAPVEMFAADTTYSMLDLQIAVSGTQINLGVSVSAIPASGETVVVAAGLYGEWLR